ncbi:MAG: glycerol-3-phosphate 1-O-acyltransferase PlsY [Gemmatimonadetes bacterium]|nr:glycerol-3-phosphate 1-O-acyltransferase PlsY [Gemmatimonadota bacterium]
MSPWLLLPLAYLVGATPTSYLAGQLARGIDLRRHGSGNLGATNVFRVLGWRVAIPVLVLDIAKGWAPTFLLPRWDTSPAVEWAAAYGGAAVLGHVYSLYVGLRGGKGVATSAGVLLALAPVATLAGLAVWAALLALTRIVSVASLSAALVLPAAVYLTRAGGTVFVLSLLLAAFIVYAHRANIRRLLRGEEHRFGRSTRPAH